MNRRFVAYLLDGLFVAILGSVASGIALGLFALHDTRADRLESAVIQATVSVAYFVISWTKNGASPGQRALGLHTLRDEDGGPLTETQALTRWAWLYAPGAAIPLAAPFTPSSTVGLMWIGLLIYVVVLYRTTSTDPLRRGFHDQQSGSVVMGPSFTPVKPSAPSAATPPPS